MKRRPNLNDEDEAGVDGADRGPSERIYRGLLRGVYEGRYVPGQRLAAPDLMREYDVGRGTVREVLHRLASSGVVTIVPNRGAAVRMLSRQETTEILDIVELLLGLAARGAARAIEQGEDPAQLDNIHERLRAHASGEDFAGFLDARESFYRHIVRMSGNRELQRLFPTVQVHIMRLQLRAFNRAADSLDFAGYAELAAAIRAGDALRAERSAHQHVRRTMESVAMLPDRAFLRRE
jgi:DNA-binding GntR family transcriptional regulator